MNALYRSHRALWEMDTEQGGFQWLNADDAAHNTFSWLRFGTGDRAVDAPVVACVMNFSGATHERYRIGVPRPGRWTVVLDTAGYHPDAPSSTGVVIEAQEGGWHGQPYAVDVTVPRLSTVWLVPLDEPAEPGQLVQPVEPGEPTTAPEPDSSAETTADPTTTSSTSAAAGKEGRS